MGRVLIFMPYVMPLDIFQMGVTALTFLVSTMAQINATFNKKENKTYMPDNSFIYPFTGVTDSRGYNIIVSGDSLKKLTPTQTILHYTEYCTSASLLFIAVSILFMPDPLSWTVAVSFVSILLCNLTGIGAHYCKLDQQHYPYSVVRSRLVQAGKPLQVVHVPLVVGAAAGSYNFNLYLVELSLVH